MKTIEQYQSEIEKLVHLAETGNQWAEICRLEAEMIMAMCTKYSVPHVGVTKRDDLLS